MSISLHNKYLKLTNDLKDLGRVLVAFSGGCDSTFLLAAARRVLGHKNVLAVTAVSASLPTREKENTVRLIQQLDVSHQFLNTKEMSNPNYVSNPSNRCFFCKNELFSQLAPLAKTKRMVLVDGFNVSDRADVRPGVQAAKAWAVLHPLDQAELTKQNIRVLSRWWKLPTWNKPASPCLSSRLPYGTPVTLHALSQIEQAESFLQAEGFSIVRVRYYGQEARIEVPLSDLPRLQIADRWQRVENQLHNIGFSIVTVDSRGFKSGRLNETVTHA